MNALEPLPLGHFPTFATRDPSELESGVGTLLSPHRLRTVGRDALDARVNSVELGPIRLIAMRYGTSVGMRVTAPIGYFAVTIPISGTVSIHGDVFDASRYAVFTPGDELRMDWSSDLTSLVVRLEEAAVRRHLSAMAPSADADGLRFDSTWHVDRAAAFRGMIGLLMDVATGGPVPPLVQRRLEEAAMTALLMGMSSSASRALSSREPAAALSAVRRATEIMHDDPESVVGMPDLARRVGVSVRSLQLGFRRTTGSGPAAHLLGVRLDRARASIESAAASTVAAAAGDSGFIHLGRFAADYRRRFGENPSETVRRTRLRTGSGLRERDEDSQSGSTT